jgi:crotonobetainyl-CoA:carnitine CoA-transferase CaiB-like acyl-CoA transferase
VNSAPSARALEGIRVLDFSRLLPGPYCSLLLSDLGADVVKIEEPGSGDYARWYPPMVGDTSGSFAALNRDKRSVSVNLKSPAGVAVVRRLAERADVVLESFRPGVMDRLGIGYTALSGANPRLIYCAISGYGQDGPYRDRAGHDINYAAMAGVTALTGARGEKPTLIGVQVGDYTGALYGALSILGALFARTRTGLGQFLDISMTEGALSFLTLYLGKVAAGSTSVTRGEEELAGGLPCYDIYATADGKAMSLGPLEPKFWQAFCNAIERPELAGQGYLRGAAGDEVRAELARIFRTRTRDEWVAFLRAHDVCCEPVLEPAELASHPLHRSRGAFIDIGGFVFSRTPVGPRGAEHRRAPRLGEHTREVLGEAGFLPEEIDALFESGALAGT